MVLRCSSKRARVRAFVFLTVASFSVILAIPSPAPAQQETPEIASRGYDVVAFFVENRAVKGSGEIAVDHDGKIYHFSNAENRDAFVASPETYLPQFDGFCAYGVAQGVKKRADPEAFTIVDGKLFFNVSKGVQDVWRQDVDGYVEKANGNWMEPEAP